MDPPRRNGATRDPTALREAAERGKRVVQVEHYEITSSTEQGTSSRSR